MDLLWSMPSKAKFKDTLRRGIGYHHAGLKHTFSGPVEMLFRKKYLQVLFYWLLFSRKVSGRLINDVE